ncbi:hypothetical protein FB45DRAFT_1053716 [Roridomyces roridus]|uniref:Uncharacterized protein n=1 Tax=Roridomyces roridus TaxID=1738132 RepID=A0AAD7C7G0_9AGAR|nr:hypothetical protein FB45DRAFT_1053716 [Roridomyces roridus]
MSRNINPTGVRTRAQVLAAKGTNQQKNLKNVGAASISAAKVKQGFPPMADSESASTHQASQPAPPRTNVRQTRAPGKVPASPTIATSPVKEEDDASATEELLPNERKTLKREGALVYEEVLEEEDEETDSDEGSGGVNRCRVMRRVWSNGAIMIQTMVQEDGEGEGEESDEETDEDEDEDEDEDSGAPSKASEFRGIQHCRVVPPREVEWRVHDRVDLAIVVPSQFRAPSATSSEGIKGKENHDQDNLDKSKIKVEKNASACGANVSEETRADVDVEGVGTSSPKTLDDEETTITVKGKGKARVGAKSKTAAVDRESKPHGYPTRLAEKLKTAAKNGENNTAADTGKAESSKSARRVFIRLPEAPSTTLTAESAITQSFATATQNEQATEEHQQRPVIPNPRTPLRLAQGNVVPASPKTPKTPTIATSPVKENEDTSQPYERKPLKREGAFYEHYSGSRGQKRLWEEVETDVETEVETDKEQTPHRAAKRCRTVKILDNE